MNKHFFDYSKHFPGDWPKEIASLKQAGAELVSVPIYWGVHEKTRGVRDFTKSSRLKLEKVFSLIEGIGLKAEAVMGFFPDSRSFPDWTAEVSERAIVSSGLWDSGLGTFETRSVPSILAPQVREGFFNFVQEVISILALYRAPEGPLSGVVFDPGIYQSDLRLIDMNVFGSYLKGRYQDVSQLNLHYQTLFKDFGSVASRSGLRTLFDKRSWLAGWDFRSSRRSILESLKSEFSQIAKSHEIEMLGAEHKEGPSTSEWEFVFEDTLIESCSGEPVAPLVACGQITSSAVLAFRIAEVLKAELNKTGKDLELVSFWSQKPSTASLIGVAGSRYLPAPAAEKLKRRLEEGASLFFAFGLPHLTETMEAIHLGIPSEKTRIRCEDQELIWIKFGNGSVFYPVPEWSVNDDLGRKTSSIMNALSRSLAHV